ncbi:FAD-dependent thymidylate synthase [archaeon]|nr:FAD-dependent thymidylate synthase [archaeon]
MSKIQRATSPELEAILGETFPVLDDGFIRVIDYMGNDQSIVQAARVSYGAGTKKVSEDRGLIRYLLRNNHTTPFEMAELKLHVKVPMDAWRQWIRHRTASVNEISSRYSIVTNTAQKTDPNEWRIQGTGNKQGSEGVLDPEIGKKLTQEEEIFQEYAKATYEGRIAKGVAREQARKDIPLCTYTEAYWKMDLHNLLHFLDLRMDPHAQQEIRSYADVIGNEIVAKWVPLTWESFEDYKINARGLTGLEDPLIGALINNQPENAVKLAISYGWLEQGKKGLKNNRERQEFEIKAKRWKLPIPW